MNNPLTYGELMMLCEGHGTSKIYQRHLEIVGQLEQQLFDEQALHHATQLRLTAAIESSGKCANRVQALRQQLAAMTQERDEQCAGKMAFYNGMNDMREQRTKLERQLSKANKVQP